MSDTNKDPALTAAPRPRKPRAIDPRRVALAELRKAELRVKKAKIAEARYAEARDNLVTAEAEATAAREVLANLARGKTA